MKIFKEEQRFKQTWLVLLLTVSAIAPIVIVGKEYIDGKISINDLMLVLLFIIIATGFIFFLKLTTRIDENGIEYRFFPFHFSNKKIPWHTIEKAHVRKYDAISEYGGWGLKGGLLWKKSKGIAINVSGDIGIQLELKDGKKILIGTQKENDTKKTLATYKHKIN